jgi:hypothetical protein
MTPESVSSARLPLIDNVPDVLAEYYILLGFLKQETLNFPYIVVKVVVLL